MMRFPVVHPGDDEPVIALSRNNHGGLWLGTMQGGVKSFDQGRVIAEPEVRTDPTRAS